MIASPLLSNARHRAMITPASPLSILGSFILARVAGQFFIRLKYYSQDGNCPWDWILNPMFYANPLLRKTFSSIWIMLYKILNSIGQLWLWWMSPTKAQANEADRTPPATWTWKAGHETKIYEQWQGTKKRARVNNLVKWDRPLGSGTNIQSKQVRVHRYKS